VTARIPDPAREPNPQRRLSMEAALGYMGLTPGNPIEEPPSIGCSSDPAPTGDCRICARRPVLSLVARWRRRSSPGWCQVRRRRGAGGARGLDQIFKSAGFDWRAPGCSMCLGANGDIIGPGERSVSTTNRNFVEGRARMRARTGQSGDGCCRRRHRQDYRRSQVWRIEMEKFIRVTGAAVP